MGVCVCVCIKGKVGRLTLHLPMGLLISYYLWDISFCFFHLYSLFFFYFVPIYTHIHVHSLHHKGYKMALTRQRVLQKITKAILDDITMLTRNFNEFSFCSRQNVSCTILGNVNNATFGWYITKPC